MLFIITYDISDKKILNRVSKILEKKALRIQNSTFELNCEYEEAEKLFYELFSYVNPKTDKLFLFNIKETKTTKERFILV